MKLKSSLVLLPLAAACAALNVHAQSIVTFQGTVMSSSCTASVTTGGGTVSLPMVMASDLSGGAGTTAGATPFVVAVVGCGASPGITAKTYFYNTAANAVTDGRLNTLPAKGWQFQIVHPTAETQFPVGTSPTPPAPAANPDPGASIASGTANINYRVRYRSNSATITPGAASATANFVLQFV